MNELIETLVPVVRDKAKLFIEKCAESGIDVRVVGARRPMELQCLYALSGRIKNDQLAEQALIALSKLYAPWTFAPAETHVERTWTMESNHLDGHALDIEIFDYDGKKVWPKDAPELWEDAIQIAEKIGFTCGARWKKPDWPHLEWRK